MPEEVDEQGNGGVGAQNPSYSFPLSSTEDTEAGDQRWTVGYDNEAKVSRNMKLVGCMAFERPAGLLTSSQNQKITSTESSKEHDSCVLFRKIEN
jgi:hypothetical protein